MTEADKLKFPRGTPRDPARIDAILAAIAEVWYAYPDMRLGQLLVNLLDPEWNKLFTIEDDVLAERLREFAETGRWPAAS